MLGGGRAKSAILYTYEGIAIEDVNGISPFTGASGADEPLKILRVENSNGIYMKSHRALTTIAVGETANENLSLIHI